MLKIAAGKYRSRQIEVPPSLKVPTKSIVRTALGNALSEKIIGSRVLDLFAGSGALGIECLSRGASHCDFVDVSSESCVTIKENLKKLHEANAGVFCSDFLIFLQQVKDVYDVVLIDPPYAKKEYYPRAIEALIETKAIQEGGVIVLEYEGEKPSYPSSYFEKEKDYHYGRSNLTILWRKRP